MFVVAGTTLAWMVDSWRTPDAVGQMPFPEPDEPRLIVLAHRSGAARGGRAGAHRAAAARAGPPVASRYWWSSATTTPARPRSPTGWPRPTHGSWWWSTTACRRTSRRRSTGRCRTAPARSSASSTPRTRSRPGLLRHVDACFRANRAHVVQGGVQLMNYRSSWWSLRNTLEYFFWFSSRLHFHARNGFIPLGGNTVFVRTDLLRLVGGWDTECLAEDCELGIRLSVAGARVAVAYSPELATREETPPTLRGLVQAAHPVEPGLPAGAAARASGGGCPASASGRWPGTCWPCRSCRRSPGSWCRCRCWPCSVSRRPAPFVLLTFVPLAATLATLAVEIIGLSEFNRMFDAAGAPARLRQARPRCAAVPAAALLRRAARLGAANCAASVAGRRPNTSAHTGNSSPPGVRHGDRHVRPGPASAGPRRWKARRPSRSSRWWTVGCAGGCGGVSSTTGSTWRSSPVLMVLGGIVHVAACTRSPARFDDEGTYTAYALGGAELARARPLHVLVRAPAAGLDADRAVDVDDPRVRPRPVRRGRRP